MSELMNLWMGDYTKGEVDNSRWVEKRSLDGWMEESLCRVMRIQSLASSSSPQEAFSSGEV